ncbi:DUF4345 domain-containing protein [Sphingomonas sp. M1-B02]|uniref:DUF4345 domain-containing protein n=1 Tax=Sphingomonas sp. M1-B02 TaxID=3114300 RepID=UPI0022408D52|nr:DUF4345 domain-containing protein [Sphingomonas sp. S6-11]UZK64811.1 DUF4345 domain-containing protein [Sphingomonas sp. S6-11]
MSPALEKRLLQIAIVAVVLVFPLMGSVMGIAAGPEWLRGDGASRDLDSHFRYLSGLLLAMSLLFLSCVPDIEQKGARMRLLAIFPIVGGLCRLWSLIDIGPPSNTHIMALCVELGVVPLFVLWQARVAGRFAR